LNCALGLLLAAVSLFGAGAAAAFFHEPRVAPLLRVTSISFFLTTAGAVPNALLAREMAFRRIAIADFVAAVTGYAVSIPCAFAGLGVWSLVIGNLANTTC